MLVVIVAILSLAVNTQGPPQAMGQPFGPSRTPRGARPSPEREPGGPKPTAEGRRQDRPARGDDVAGKGPANKDRERHEGSWGAARSGPAGRSERPRSQSQGRGRKGRSWLWLAALGELGRLGAFLRPGRSGGQPNRPGHGELKQGGGEGERPGEARGRGGRRGPKANGGDGYGSGAPGGGGPSVADRLLDELRPLPSQAEALVVAVVDERTLGPVTKSRLTLRVQPHQGDAFEVTTRVAFPTPGERAKVKVGGRVPVRYDPSDHRRVVVDMGGGGPGAGAEG
jgi:hypothetical protein